MDKVSGGFFVMNYMAKKILPESREDRFKLLMRKFN